MEPNVDSDKPSISVENVFKSYSGVDAVNGINFRIHKGEIFGLLGPNGAGKSTTIKMLLDFIKPDKGEIKIYDQTFNEKTKSIIGYLPEERGLYDSITVEENLLYLASLKDEPAGEARLAAHEFLAMVGLEDKANRKIKSLSKGQRQLVQLCATLIHNPKLLILDEPFSGLDPTNRELVKQIITKEKETGKTIILSTHMMNEVEEMCDRVLMINHGRRVLYGRVDDIKESYARHCITVEFEGQFPKLEGIEKSSIRNNIAELHLRVDATPKSILKQLVDSNVMVTKFSVKELSLNQIFITVAEAEKWISP